MQKNTEVSRTRLTEHCKKHPRLLPDDVLKYIYQSSFGCEHMVSSENDVLEYIKSEYQDVQSPPSSVVEALDGDYSRVSLASLDNGISAETLARMFCLSAKKEKNAQEELEEKIKTAKELCREGALPFSFCDFEARIKCWKDSKCPPVRHSEVFRTEYHPAYRVISNRFAKFLGVFAEIDKLLSQKERVIIAIDGGSASGKTTLAATICEVYSCAVIHMDDFFLRPEQRTAERLQEVGGNIDRERFSQEVISPLAEEKSLCYRRFDCSTQTLGDRIIAQPSRLTVVEGAYSMHTSFGNYFDYSLFLDIDADYQRERIMKRNSPELAKRFFEEWIPLENIYFESMCIKERASESICIYDEGS